MRYKWIVLVLACTLLLCGCRQMGTDISGGITGETTNSTTEKTGPARVTVFQSIDTYRETLSSIYSLEDLHETFKDCAGWPQTIQKEDMHMLLEEQFFLMPRVYGSTFDTVSFKGTGQSCFYTRLSDGCALTVDLMHGKSDMGNPYPELEREYFETADGISVLHCYDEKIKEGTSDTRVRIDFYYMEIGGYLVEVFDANLCTCERKAIESLTFEKVEIK